ncbi:uncharacterized protein PFL1_05990 [Pseudozyma flocculosa PF-1]|uniref:SPX domain-containing protein n=2 Tax=Pseudozyma flocculosa TaxID=84751 RepID=A0A061H194_9BASI|nr:uncharacterized protein PFL1_05990 [Pseudozyma flocculosa PF-1]EPQ26342.1 hypothetical protein PFL1_05990 [Pseudozyma flocculosa PF-1]SPO39072.1 related to putative phosphate transporter 1 [Pseudozyma flocculosa]
MKFARYLEENTVPEWKKVYIEYRGLKKLIKRVAEHRQARLQYEQHLGLHDNDNDQHHGYSASGTSTSHRDADALRRRNNNSNSPGSGADYSSNDDATLAPPHPGTSLANSDGSKQRSDYGGVARRSDAAANVGDDAAPSGVRLPPVSLVGTNLRLAGSDPNVVEEGLLDDQDEVPDLEAQVPKVGSIGKGAADVSRKASGHSLTRDSLTVADGRTGSGAGGRGPSPEPDSERRSEQQRQQQHQGQSQESSQQPQQPPRQDSSPKRQQPPQEAPSTARPPPSPRKPQKSGSATKLKAKKVKHAYPTTLDDLIASAFDAEERKMFQACDAELEKITVFYAARELDAAHKYAQLARQLQELAEHRREYRARHRIAKTENPIAGRARKRLSQMFGALPPSVRESVRPSGEMSRDGAQADGLAATSNDGRISQSGDRGKMSIDGQLSAFDAATTTDSKHELNGKAAAARSSGFDDGASGIEDDEGQRRREQALAKMQKSLRGWDDETDRAIRLQNRAAAMSHNPEAYYAARKKLKAAVLEYYKFLETLSNYRILNRTGFAKVMKKFSKTTGVPCADAYYEARVAPSVLVTSKRLDNLMKSTEEIYTAYFEHGNRKEALNRLRTRDDTTTHHFSVFRSGLYLGIALCATVGGLVEAMKPEVQRRIPQWPALLRVYGAEFIPTLFALLFGLNLAWWHEVRINTVFIFEWDVRHTMDHRQFFEIPALLMLLLSLCFWVSFLDPFPSAIAPTTWPTVWLVIFVVVLLNPLPILYRQSRIWFVRSLLRVFSAGYKRVEFRDFFLGDELNSIAWTISNLWYFGCEWRHDWAVPDRCAPNSTFWTAALLSVPAVLRLGQCVRRWVDSERRTHLHLVNAAKYSSAVLNNFFYIRYRRNGSQWGSGDMAAWLLFASIYSVFHVSWDLLMDWSLLRRRSRHFLLRDEISFPQGVYYAFMAVDVVVRCNWFIYLLPGPASVTLRSFLAALVEMVRRACWNVLRVENEQIGNTDSFKIVRDLPLPYQQKRHRDGGSGGGDGGSDEGDDDGGSETEKRYKEGIFASIRLSSLGRKKSRIAPPTRPELDTAPVQGEVVSPLPPSTPRGDGNGSTSPRSRVAGDDDDDAEGGDAAATTTTTTGRPAGKQRTKSETILERLRDSLVPDSKVYGDRLDERAATKGRTGRDYTPRELADSDSESGTDEAT